MDSNTYPKNLEGFILLEKLKEQKKAQFLEDVMMEPMLPKIGNAKITAQQSESTNDTSDQNYNSPKASTSNITAEDGSKVEFIKHFF
jgi:hypothetical protein